MNHNITSAILSFAFLMSEYYKWVLITDWEQNREMVIAITIFNFIIGICMYALPKNTETNPLYAYNWIKVIGGVTFFTTFEVFYIIFQFQLYRAIFWTIPAWVMYLVILNLIFLRETASGE